MTTMINIPFIVILFVIGSFIIILYKFLRELQLKNEDLIKERNKKLEVYITDDSEGHRELTFKGNKFYIDYYTKNGQGFYRIGCDTNIFDVEASKLFKTSFRVWREL